MLKDFSAPQMGILFCGVFVAATWLGIWICRPLARGWIHKRRDANDLVGLTMASFSTLYGILLGLLAVEAYQDFSIVKDSVSREALGLATLYRDFDAYPQPLRAHLQDELRAYTREAIDESWGARDADVAARPRLRTIFGEVLSFTPTTKAAEIVQGESVRQINALIEQRRLRLAAAADGVPAAMWWVVALGAFLHILLMCLFDMELLVHFILGGALSLFLGAAVFLIAALDNPFTGGVTIGPEPMQISLATMK